jgi:hypothetical protein
MDATLTCPKRMTYPVSGDILMSATKSQLLLKNAYDIVNEYMSDGRQAIPPEERAFDRETIVKFMNEDSSTLAKYRGMFSESSVSINLSETTGDMFALCIVKDLSGNNHFLAAAANERNGRRRHVEQWLQGDTKNFWKDKGKLQTAKVSFYFWESPCPSCTGKILGWIRSMREAITGDADSRKVYFVFNFGAVYKSNVGDGRSTWVNDQQAYDEYKKVSAAAGSTAPISNSKGVYTVPILTFRQSHPTQADPYTFDGIAGKAYQPSTETI